MNVNCYRWVCGRAALAILCLCAIGSLPALAQNPENAVKPIKKVVPEYPAVLKQMGVGGSVRLHVTVGADGNVEGIEVRGGNAILADAAVKAVKQWKFPASGAKKSLDVSAEFECCTTVKMTP
jgi:TonB family protein